MKTNFLLVIITTVMFATSCGSPKKAVSSSEVTGDVLIAMEPCEEYAMQKPAQRASGMGIHFQESTAKNMAELQARAALARALQSCIETTITNYADGTTLFSADKTQGTSVTDQSAAINDRAEGMANELIKGAVMVKISKYHTPNNQYKIYVCLEYQEDVAQMASKISKSFGEMLTQDQKLNVKFNEQQFKEEMEKKLKDYKGATMQ